MNRHRALTIAATVAATTIGATMAFGANVGLLGFSRVDPPSVGALEADQTFERVQLSSPTTAAAPELLVAPTTDTLPPEVIVQYEDIYVPAPKTLLPAAPSAPLPEMATIEAAPPTTATPIAALPAAPSPPVAAPDVTAPTTSTTDIPARADVDAPTYEDDDDEHADDAEYDDEYEGAEDDD